MLPGQRAFVPHNLSEGLQTSLCSGCWSILTFPPAPFLPGLAAELHFWHPGIQQFPSLLNAQNICHCFCVPQVAGCTTVAQHSPAALFIASVLSPITASQFLAGPAPEVPSLWCQGLAHTSTLRVPPTASCPAGALLHGVLQPGGITELSTALIMALITALITGLPA